MAEPGTLTPTHPAIRAYAITTAVLAALFFVLLILYLNVLQKERNRKIDAHGITQTTSENNTGSARAKTSVGIPPEPAVVLTRTGMITRISKDEIAFTAVVFDEGKGEYAQTAVIATTDNDTKYTEVDKTKNSVPVPGQPSSLANSHSIKRSDFKADDQIQVFAASNIQGERRFAVTEVRRLLIR